MRGPPRQAAAAVAGFAVGALLTRLMGSSASRPMGKRSDDLHHTSRPFT